MPIDMRMHILVFGGMFDDRIRLLVNLRSKAIGFKNVLGVVSGESALRTIQGSERFDLVIVDRDLYEGEMSGPEFYAEARKLPGYKELPGILIYGSDRERALAETQRTGMTSCIPKPVALSALRNAIVDIFGEF